MTLWYLTFLAAIAGTAWIVMTRCDFRDRVGMVGYLVLIAMIDAFQRIGAPEYVAAGVLHFIFGASLVILSTRVVGVAIGVLSFAISILVGLAIVDIIPHETGRGVAFNIYHWGMSFQWVQVAVFAATGMGVLDLDRDAV